MLNERVVIEVTDEGSIQVIYNRLVGLDKPVNKVTTSVNRLVSSVKAARIGVAGLSANVKKLQKAVNGLNTRSIDSLIRKMKDVAKTKSIKISDNGSVDRIKNKLQSAKKAAEQLKNPFQEVGGSAKNAAKEVDALTDSTENLRRSARSIDTRALEKLKRQLSRPMVATVVRSAGAGAGVAGAAGAAGVGAALGASMGGGITAASGPGGPFSSQMTQVWSRARELNKGAAKGSQKYFKQALNEISAGYQGATEKVKTFTTEINKSTAAASRQPSGPTAEQTRRASFDKQSAKIRLSRSTTVRDAAVVDKARGRRMRQERFEERGAWVAVSKRRAAPSMFDQTSGKTARLSRHTSARLGRKAPALPSPGSFAALSKGDQQSQRMSKMWDRARELNNGESKGSSKHRRQATDEIKREIEKEQELADAIHKKTVATNKAAAARQKYGRSQSDKGGMPQPSQPFETKAKSARGLLEKQRKAQQLANTAIAKSNKILQDAADKLQQIKDNAEAATKAAQRLADALAGKPAKIADPNAAVKHVKKAAGKAVEQPENMSANTTLLKAERHAERLRIAEQKAAKAAKRLADQLQRAMRVKSGRSTQAVNNLSRSARTATGGLRGTRDATIDLGNASSKVDRLATAVMDVSKEAQKAKLKLDRLSKPTKAAGVRSSLGKIGTAASSAKAKVGGLKRKLDTMWRSVKKPPGANGFESLKAGMVGLVSALGISQLARYADEWSTITGLIAVATKTHEQALAVQNKLYTISQRTRTPLKAMASLYARAARAGKDLGATQSQILKFTEGVGKALVVQHTSATTASGALMQLGQLLGSTRIMAEEFNSINEGAPVILQAVADNIDAAGGSISKLKRLVVAGKVTNKQFFDAFLEGTADIEKDFQKASYTIDQGLGLLNDAMVKFVGQINEVTKASTSFGKAAKFLADNMEVLAASLVIVLSPLIIYTFTTALTALFAVMMANPFSVLIVAGVLLLNWLTSANGKSYLLRTTFVILGQVVSGLTALITWLANSFGWLLGSLLGINDAAASTTRTMEDAANKLQSMTTEADALAPALDGVATSADALGTAMENGSKHTTNWIDHIASLADGVLHLIKMVALMPAWLVSPVPGLATLATTGSFSAANQAASNYVKGAAGAIGWRQSPIQDWLKYTRAQIGGTDADKLHPLSDEAMGGGNKKVTELTAAEKKRVKALLTSYNGLINAYDRAESAKRRYARAVAELSLLEKAQVWLNKQLTDGKITESQRESLRLTTARRVELQKMAHAALLEMKAKESKVLAPEKQYELDLVKSNLEESVRVFMARKYGDELLRQQKLNQVLLGLRKKGVFLSESERADIQDKIRMQLVLDRHLQMTNGFINQSVTLREKEQIRFAALSRLVDDSSSGFTRIDALRSLAASYGNLLKGTTENIEIVEAKYKESLDRLDRMTTQVGVLTAQTATQAAQRLRIQTIFHEASGNLAQDAAMKLAPKLFAGTQEEIDKNLARHQVMYDRIALMVDNNAMSPDTSLQVARRERAKQIFMPQLSSNLALDFAMDKAPDLFKGTQEARDRELEGYRKMYAQIKQMQIELSLSDATAAQMRLKVDNQVWAERLQGMSDFYGGLATLADSGNKTLGAIGKVAAISQALIAGYLAVQKALASGPYPYNLAMAAAVGVQATANVAKISGIGFKTGGDFRVGGAGGPDSQQISFRATPGEHVRISTPEQVRHGDQAEKRGEPTVNNTSIVFNISTPDVAGFQRSQSQMAASASRMIAKGDRNR